MDFGWIMNPFRVRRVEKIKNDGAKAFVVPRAWLETWRTVHGLSPMAAVQERGFVNVTGKHGVFP